MHWNRIVLLFRAQLLCSLIFKNPHYACPQMSYSVCNLFTSFVSELYFVSCLQFILFLLSHLLFINLFTCRSVGVKGCCTLLNCDCEQVFWKFRIFISVLLYHYTCYLHQLFIAISESDFYNVVQKGSNSVHCPLKCLEVQCNMYRLASYLCWKHFVNAALSAHECIHFLIS